MHMIQGFTLATIPQRRKEAIINHGEYYIRRQDMQKVDVARCKGIVSGNVYEVCASSRRWALQYTAHTCQIMYGPDIG